MHLDLKTPYPLIFSLPIRESNDKCILNSAYINCSEGISQITCVNQMASGVVEGSPCFCPLTPLVSIQEGEVPQFEGKPAR